MPEIDGRYSRETTHRVSVLGRRGHDYRTSLREGEPVVAARHRQARHQPLDVPLPWAWKRLIEVVDVEDHAALWRGVCAEIGEVGIAADLRPDPRDGQRSEIGRHHEGRATEECERRDQHAPAPHTPPLGTAVRTLLSEQC